MKASELFNLKEVFEMTQIEREVSRQRKWQLKRQQEGKCITCGKPREQYKTYCDSCHTKRNELDLKKYYRRTAD